MFSASVTHLRGAISMLRHIPAVSMPVLAEDFRKTLLEEANEVPLRAAKETVGKGRNSVSQRMLLQDKLDPNGRFATLAAGFQSLFDRACADDDFFSDQVVFNDWMLQKYEPGDIGITPHRDRTDYRHVVCLFVLAGHGRFCISEDRARTNEQEIANLPGDVVLMAAPGFRFLEQRPFHCLERITEERIVFGLRHDESKR